MKDSFSSVASHIKQLLYEDGLPSAYEVLMDPPEKGAWKETVKQAMYIE